jgi:hypothetical protein
MKSWKVRLLTLLTVVAGLLAVAGPAAMADDCNFRDRGHRDDVVVCRFDANDFDFEDDEFDELNAFGFFPFFFNLDDEDFDFDNNGFGLEFNQSIG